ncbi:MAG: hypothetical protein IPO41_14910 [Acidobacteria bacterium]|nr:hypothetical protein [Acidobacteriota bacterium]
MAELDKYYAPQEINRLRTLALGVGGIALIIWAVGAYFNPGAGTSLVVARLYFLGRYRYRRSRCFDASVSDGRCLGRGYSPDC